MTVQDLVVENVQPKPVSGPTVPVAVNPLLQLSETVVLPNAAATCAEVGLQPTAVMNKIEITGGSVSRV